jgi:hypothetical protein
VVVIYKKLLAKALAKRGQSGRKKTVDMSKKICYAIKAHLRAKKREKKHLTKGREFDKLQKLVFEN